MEGEPAPRLPNLIGIGNILWVKGPIVEAVKARSVDYAEELGLNKEKVKEIQRIVLAPVTGVYDEATKNKVKEYQVKLNKELQSAGLPRIKENGYWDSDTEWAHKHMTAGRPAKLTKQQEEDINWIAIVLMSEASVGNAKERLWVGWVLRNRVESPVFPKTYKRAARSGFATNQRPGKPSVYYKIAEKIYFAPSSADPTGGANYFISPRGLKASFFTPKRRENYYLSDEFLRRYGEKVWFPNWAQDRYRLKDIPGIRPWYYIFYRRPR